MKDLVSYLIEKITDSSDFSVDEVIDDGKVELIVEAKPEIIGLIIGKGGKTIKNIRKIASVRATLEDKVVNISVREAVQ